MVRLEGLGKLKKIHLIRTRSHDLPACTIVHQPTTLLRAHIKSFGENKKFRNVIAVIDVCVENNF
jgi:hypothetical protein